MHFTSTEEIYRLVRAFEERTISKPEWTHAAHLAVGLYYLTRLPFSVAKNVMRDGIHWLNDRHGTPNTDNSGYHETLTVFWMKRIWNFLDEHEQSRNLAALANDLIEQLKDPDLPLRHYTYERLFSVSARRDYISPDRRMNGPVTLSVRLCTLTPLI